MPSDLTIDLVADWELTSGPASSVGGPTFTEHGSPTYGANGVLFNGTNQWLDCAFSLDNTKDLFVYYEAFHPTSPPSTIVVDFGMANGSGGYFDFSTLGDHPSPNVSYETFIYYVDGPTYTGPSLSPPGGLNNSSTGILWGWRKNSTNETAAQLNNGVIVTGTDAIISPPIGDTLTLSGFVGGTPDYNGYIRRLRIWNGNSIALINSIPDRTWLYNGGSGRTYAEILATGGGGGGSGSQVFSGPSIGPGSGQAFSGVRV